MLLIHIIDYMFPYDNHPLSENKAADIVRTLQDAEDFGKALF